MDEVPDLVPNNDMVSEVNTEGSNGSADKGSKKTKKGKNASGETKISKKKKNEITDLDALEVKEELIGNGVLANEFEKVAAEVGMDMDGRSSSIHLLHRTIFACKPTLFSPIAYDFSFMIIKQFTMLSFKVRREIDSVYGR
ncbi:hypothetical protein GIB67_032121 [Kingdonia uniflora]|uniref:Uncharacterized protein n=1 Tax=Kingdonia uniflora TaxID=39325 RepID=A0A7J7MX48_9MAGN|nr:hypothetical protein GIB67_032121 [Kingdonia uniflora]